MKTAQNQYAQSEQYAAPEFQILSGRLKYTCSLAVLEIHMSRLGWRS
jgi:hypothetical protein